MQFDDPNVVLARELNSLSLQERNRVIESIHGVDDVVKETPQWIVKKLREFQKSLNKLLQADSEQTNITVATREAYEEAQRQSKTYVQNRAFRLMFLRAESFDASLAAQRMLVYLEEKLSRFGPEALTRPLILTDLSPQSRAMLIDLGIFQVLPTRDSVGRAIFLIHEDGSPGDMFREDPMAATNLVFYILSVLAEDEETQKRGIVGLQVISVLPKLDDMEVIRINLKRGNSCDWSPVRIKANHIWAKTFSNNPLIRVILNTWSKGARMRLRIHAGSYTELRYQLLTFGFPSDCLPYSTDGEELTTNAHKRWLSRRMMKESMVRSYKEFKGLDLPGYRDVCLGRGSASHQHAGNAIMRALMTSMIEEYRVATGKERKELNKRLIKMVRDGGGRFLAKTSDGWYEVVGDEAEIEQKVGGSFRGMISRTSLIASSSCQGEDLQQIDKRGDMAAKRPRLDFGETGNNHCCGMESCISPTFNRPP